MLTALRKFEKNGDTLEIFYDEIEDSGEYTEGTVVCTYTNSDKTVKISIEVCGEQNENEDGELVDNNWFEALLYYPLESNPKEYVFEYSQEIDEDISSMNDEELFDYLTNLFAD